MISWLACKFSDNFCASFESFSLEQIIESKSFALTSSIFCQVLSMLSNEYSLTVALLSCCIQQISQIFTILQTMKVQAAQPKSTITTPIVIRSPVCCAFEKLIKDNIQPPISVKIAIVANMENCLILMLNLADWVLFILQRVSNTRGQQIVPGNIIKVASKN